jgi:hypothetical protein
VSVVRLTLPAPARPLPDREPIMKRFPLIPALAVVSLGLFASACDKKVDPAQKKACEEFATHLADIIQKDQGETVPADQIAKMFEATVGACVEHPPSEAELKCAMAAQDLKTMKACDPAAEAEAKAEG